MLNSHIYYRDVGVDYGPDGKDKMCDSLKFNQSKEDHDKVKNNVKSDKTKIYMGSMWIRKK